MNVIFVALNAKYIHTNPAVRGIAALCEAHGLHIEIVERTVNNTARSLLMDLCRTAGDAYIFSAYIWNISMVESLAADLRKIRPDAVLAVAGPQVSFHCTEFLRTHPAFDAVLCGEGELSAPEYLARLKAGESLAGCPGLVYREGGGIAAGPPPPPVSMDMLPFAYGDLEALEGRILYYESMRGCPFRCSYCLSQSAGTLRLRSLPLVFADLDRFLAAGAKQVKFVDRTFNAAKEHAMAIWRYLTEHDNGVTNFHFELSGELLDRDMLELLRDARPGLFQFEIGVQSVSTETLREINRPFNFDRLAENVALLREQGNIHLHLDLIAGLPYEDFTGFARSFDAVFALKPDQLQLGFLKILPGTEMEEKAESFGLRYSGRTPFEVLRTDWLSFEELWELHGVADMVELYHNSGRFSKILAYLLEFYESPFAFFRELWAWYLGAGYGEKPLSKIGYYDILAPFMSAKGIPVTERARWLCKYDVVRVEKPRKLPDWVNVDLSARYRTQILDLITKPGIVRNCLPGYVGMEPKRILREAHVEVFPFSPETGVEAPTAALFDYRSGKAYLFPFSGDGRICP